jgi:small subunit ribosomal protein S17e
MGRIKGTLIKRTTKELLKKHKSLFTADFDHNKKVIYKMLPTQKKYRNSIAGFIARIMKREAKKK